MKKRQFLKYLGGAGVAAPFFPLTVRGQEIPKEQPYPHPDDSGFWERIREDFRLKPDYVNLENGYYCITPTPVLYKLWEHTQNGEL